MSENNIKDLDLTYLIHMDKESGKPANGKYVSKNGEDCVTYKNGLAEEVTYRHKNSIFNSKYEVGRYNNAITYECIKYKKERALNDEMSDTFYQVFEDENGLLYSKMTKQYRAVYDKNYTKEYNKGITINEYSDDGKLTYSRNEEYDMYKDCNNHYMPMICIRSIKTLLDNDQYEKTVKYYSDKDNDFIIEIKKVLNEQNDYDNAILDIQMKVYHTNDKIMVNIFKVSEDVYNVIYYDMNGTQTLFKTLSKEDACRLVVCIECYYKNWKIDYKNVYNVINNVEKTLTEYSDCSCCCTCSYGENNE